MADRNWEKELADIDRRIASEPATGAVPVAPVATPNGAKAAAVPNGAVAPRSAPAGATTSAPTARRHWTATAGLLLRLALVGLLVAVIVVWPYDTRCGVWLSGYLATMVVAALGAIWSSVAAWRHRAALVHLLSLGALAATLVYGAIEVLPRVGYAMPNPAHPAMWACR